MSINQFSLLSKKRFLPYFITQFLGALNDNIYKNAAIILITYKLSEGALLSPAMTITTAAGIFILPFFLFSVIAGQLADKYDKSYLIKLLKVIEVLIMLGAAAAFILGNPTALIIILFLMGTQSAFFSPVKYSIIRQHLYDDELIGGNGLVSAATFAAILLGTIIGGLLVLVEPYGVEFVILVSISVALAGLISSMYIPRAESANSTLIPNLNIFAASKEIFSEISGSGKLLPAVLSIAWFWFLGAAFTSQLPIFTRDSIGGDETIFLLFFIIFAVGVISGALLCNRILRSHISVTFVPVSVFVISLFTFDLYTASLAFEPSNTARLIGFSEFLQNPVSWRFIIDMLGISVSAGFFIVPLNALVQSESTDKKRARIIAGSNMLNAFFMIISAVIIAILLWYHFNVPEIFLTFGILNLFFTIFTLQLLPYKSLKIIAKKVLRFFYRVEIFGLENFEKAGEKVVIVANHVSMLDPLLLSVFLPEKMTFVMLKQASEKWWLRPWRYLVNIFIIDRTSPMTARRLISQVKAGEKIIIFPEGRPTVTGSMMKVYEGPGMVADWADANLLPIRIKGTQYSPFTKIRDKVRVRLFPKVTINILPPIDFHAPEGIHGRIRRKEVGYKLHEIMASMMFESTEKEKTLFKSLVDAMYIHGSSKKIIEDTTREAISYFQLITRSFILGRVIASETTRGDYVGVMLPNSIGAAVTFFGLQAYGRIPAMINFSTGARNIKHAIKIAKINKIYTSRKFIQMAKLHECVEELSQVVEIVYLEDFRKKIGIRRKLAGLAKAFFTDLSYKVTSKDMKPSDPAVILFTSGSEGLPKGVVLSHLNIQSNRSQMSAAVDFGPTDVIFNAMPVFHSFGMTVGMILPLITGAKAFLYPHPLHYRVIPEIVYDIGATIMFGTNTFLSGYAKFAHSYDFYNMRYVFAGAEKLKESTRKLWSEKFGIRILEGYGATETSPVLCTNTQMFNRDGTVGKFIPGVEYYLRPVEGVNSGGVLTVKGANIMLGYLLADEPGKIIPPTTEKGEGWYDTGDIVEVSKDGFVTIVGRVKRFAKVSGEMISLTFVEEFIVRRWPEGEHAVISIPNEKKGEELILMTNTKEITRKILIDLATKEGVGVIFMPYRVVYVASIPTLPTGKVDYVKVKEIVEEELGF